VKLFKNAAVVTHSQGEEKFLKVGRVLVGGVRGLTISKPTS